MWSLHTPLLPGAQDVGVGLVSATDLAAPQGLPTLTLRAGQECAQALDILRAGRCGVGDAGVFAELASGRSPGRTYTPHRTSAPGRRTTCREGVRLLVESGGARVGTLLVPGPFLPGDSPRPLGWGSGGGSGSRPQGPTGLRPWEALCSPWASVSTPGL